MLLFWQKKLTSFVTPGRFEPFVAATCLQQLEEEEEIIVVVVVVVVVVGGGGVVVVVVVTHIRSCKSLILFGF